MNWKIALVSTVLAFVSSAAFPQSREPIPTIKPPGNQQPLQAPAVEVENPTLAPKPAITLLAKHGSNEFVEWVDAITINTPTSLSLKWSAKPVQPAGIKWVVTDKPVTKFEHPAIVSGMAKGSVKGSEKNFSVGLQNLVPKYPPAAPNKYEYWVYAWPVDANGESIGGNRSHVRVTYKAQETTHVFKPCSSNKDCGSGTVCGAKEQTCVALTSRAMEPPWLASTDLGKIVGHTAAIPRAPQAVTINRLIATWLANPLCIATWTTGTRAGRAGNVNHTCVTPLPTAL